MEPIVMFVLSTEETAGVSTGYRTYLLMDEGEAQRLGRRLKAAAPTEVSRFVYRVTPAEGKPQ